MTAIPQPSSSRAVSDRIATPLREVAARQWSVVAATGVLKTLAAALALLLLTAVVLGTAVTLPGALRIILAAAAWALVAISGMIFLRPALRRRTLADAAFTVEQRTPGLDERLSSTVELSSEPEPFAGSPALLRHLARQAEADAAALRPELVVPADAVRRWAILLAPLLLLWLTFAVLFPRPLLGGLYRTLMPWKEHLPAVLTRIAVTPGDVTLAEGDALEIKASINTASGSETPGSPPLLHTAPLDAADAHPLAHDLQRLSPREFRASFDNLLQSFRYRVSTDQGESPWFTATVLPRPSVAALDLRYDYPPYARLDARTVANADGDVRALQGTDVTLTLHASESLDLAPGKSRITVTEGARQRTLDLRPLDGQPNVYEANLTVFNSGSYRIQLVNRHRLTNKDERPRTIAAELDQPPKVAITSPDSQVSVRPDDDVPVVFKASDDFGVAKLVALVQVDDKPAEERDVPAPADADRRQIEGQYVINVADTLSRAGVDEAKTFTYWLRVTDNRDPDPQSAESARQTLKVDKYQQLPYRARVEQDQAKDLTRAIDKAIQRLNQSEGQVNSLKSIDPKRLMNPEEKRRSDEQRDQLGTTAKELADAAESNRRTSFGAVAEKARQVAEGPIQSAAEDVARSRLSDEEPEARNKAAAQAAEQIVDARKRLEELKKGIEARAREVQSTHELEKLAERQTQLAEAQAKAVPKPKKDDSDPAAREAAREAWRQAQQKLQQRQRELIDRLNRAIGQDESLLNPKAVEQATKLRELLDRVQQIQKDQGTLQEQVAKDERITALREQSDELAARQRKLNDDIDGFSEKRYATLRTADARTPERSHQAAIVDHLRKGEIDPARDRQKQSVEQLGEAKRKLEERGRSNELKPDAVQQNALNLQEQAKQAAQQVAAQAQQAGEKLKQAKAANDAEQAAQARKDVDEAAGALAKQAKAAEAAVAEALTSDDATAKKNAEDARRAADAAEAAADAARQAAQRDDAEQAARKLDESAKQLAAARQKASDAVKADFVGDQRDAAKAAASQAKELAERQKQLADDAKENAEALAKARKDQQSLEDVANRQGQLEDQTNQAKQQADQLEQLAKADKSPLAERVEGAKKFLDAAINDQAEAAQAEQANAQAHRQIGQLLQQAGEADQQKAQVDQQSAQAAEHADVYKQQAEAARQSQADAEARGDADAARASKEQADREKQQADQDEQRAKQIEAQAESPRQRAAEGLKQVNAARTTATASRRKAAEKQAAAQDALAGAEDALRDVDRMAAASARVKRANARRQDPGSTERADAAADADAGKQDATDVEAAAAGGRAMTPEEAARQAARGAQEASQSQQQAINSASDAAQSLDASRQAAAALQEAAAAMAAANAASSAASTDSVATAPEEQTPSQGLGKGEQAGRPSSARAMESRNGIGVSAGGTDDRPVSVQQLGISAGDWARLGPLTRQELLNAAQQNGPPAYREMIKNYYVRIAKLDRERRSNGPQSQTPTEPRNGKKR